MKSVSAWNSEPNLDTCSLKLHPVRWELRWWLIERGHYYEASKALSFVRVPMKEQTAVAFLAMIANLPLLRACL